MLSLNFKLIKSSPIRELPYWVLFIIFGVIYLDMYDVALYIGYSIYLHPVLLPHLQLYEAFLIFGTIFLLSQVAKVGGYVWFYLFSKNTKYYLIAPIIIGVCYMLLAFHSGYNQIGYSALYFFAFVRVIQGCAMGFELAFILQFASSQLDYSSRRFVFYFILFAGEIGALVSVCVNRMIISHDLNIVQYDDLWRLQFIMRFIIIFAIFIIIKNKIKTSRSLKFSRLGFIHVFRKEGVYILLRSLTLSYQIALLFIIIFRLPTFISLDIGWSHAIVNRIVLQVSILGFIGANLSRFLTQYISPKRMLYILHVGGILVNLVWIITGWLVVEYEWWIGLSAFIYGALIYLNPIFLYDVADFNRRSRLQGRYLGYFFAYSLIGSIIIFILDLAHYTSQSGLDCTSLYILVVTGLLGIVGLKFYTKHFNHLLK